MTAYFLEAGVVLTAAPWTRFWDRNYFAEASPLIASLLIDNFFRGAVTGVGVISLCAGLAELVVLARRAAARRARSRTAQGFRLLPPDH